MEPNLLEEDEPQSTPTGSCDKESTGSTMSIWISPMARPLVSPGGSREWFPACPNYLKPTVGMKFNSFEEGFKFYNDYASVCGFNTRLSTSRRNKANEIVMRYCLCNKEGYKSARKKNGDQSSGTKFGAVDASKKKRLVTRVGCKAQFAIRLRDEGKYEVMYFHEGHTHPPFSPSSKKFEKQGRNLSLLHKKMIVDNSKVNIGATKTFRVVKEHVGGYDNVGAAKQDFKNFQRDLKAYIEGSDAQMFVDNFKQKQLMWSAFFFDFEMDEDGCLCRAFWADPLCRKNYGIFGDMVSFDTTYSTNRYNLIFGPFTGVDHHKKCVTFAVAFIANEDIVSFEWVFKTFIKAMGGREPTCLITDQDPAMNIAIENVFKKTEHRFCMWHIMRKMPDKVSREIVKETDFLTKLNSCVWNLEKEPEEFEKEWHSILKEYNLEDHGWLCQLFEIRHSWIPAYFRDLFLGGIMRTTSRSESENNFFTCFTNPHVTLVEFYMRYETALDSQRHAQGQNDNDSRHKFVECKTPLMIEKSASEIFTNTIFYEFQDEVCAACFACGVQELKVENDLEIAKVTEVNRRKVFEVIFDRESQETKCSCKRFDRHGLPCRHMVWLWKGKNMEAIPDKYLLKRWTSLAMKAPMFDSNGNILEECIPLVDMKKVLNDLWSEIYSCVSVAENSEEDLLSLVENLRTMRLNMEAKKASKKSTTKTQHIEFLIGSKAPTEVHVKPPKISKNKGSGSGGKRLKGEKEKEVEQRLKSKRLCGTCKEYAYHDSRNCPKKQAPQVSQHFEEESNSSTE